MSRTKYSPLENSIFDAIFFSSTCDIGTICDIYDRTQSFDDTIKMIQNAEATGRSPRDLLIEFSFQKKAG